MMKKKRGMMERIVEPTEKKKKKEMRVGKTQRLKKRKRIKKM